MAEEIRIQVVGVKMISTMRGPIFANSCTVRINIAKPVFCRGATKMVIE